MPMFTTVVQPLAGGAALAALVDRGDEAAHAVAFGGGEPGGVVDAAGERRLQAGVAPASAAPCASRRGVRWR